MKKLLNSVGKLILLSILLSACTDNNLNQVGGDSLSSNANISGVQAIVPVQFQVQPHTQSRYYTEISNTSEYMAFSLKWVGNINITSIKLENNSKNLFEFATNSDAYGIKACKGESINTGGECEVMVHITNPFIENITPVNIVVVAGGVSFKKTLTKSGGYAYIAGDFTQTYANGSLNAIPKVSGVGHCGPDGTSRCQIVRYDFANNQLTSIASTDYPVNDIALDNDNNMYIGGAFTNFIYNNKTLTNGDSTGLSSLVVKLNVAESGIVATDWLQSITTGAPNYPNGTINAIEFDSEKSKLYLAGSFNSISHYTATEGFPLLRYNFNAGVFENALGDDINNPDTSITAIAFDANDNLYLSGFYSKVSDFTFNDGFTARTINKCVLSTDIYRCLTGSSYSMSITSNQQYVDPAYSLSFQPNGGLYATGGFSYMYYKGSSVQDILGSLDGSTLIGYNPDPVGSFVNNPTNNWVSMVNSNFAPDSSVGVVTPYENGKFYAGGQFSKIGGILADGNSGECGKNGSSSCLLAKFDGSNWNKIFTTDGIINVFVIVAGIDVK